MRTAVSDIRQFSADPGQLGSHRRGGRMRRSIVLSAFVVVGLLSAVEVKSQPVYPCQIDPEGWCTGGSCVIGRGLSTASTLFFDYCDAWAATFAPNCTCVANLDPIGETIEVYQKGWITGLDEVGYSTWAENHDPIARVKLAVNHTGGHIRFSNRCTHSANCSGLTDDHGECRANVCPKEQVAGVGLYQVCDFVPTSATSRQPFANPNQICDNSHTVFKYAEECSCEIAGAQPAQVVSPPGVPTPLAPKCSHLHSTDAPPHRCDVPSADGEDPDWCSVPTEQVPVDLVAVNFSTDSESWLPVFDITYFAEDRTAPECQTHYCGDGQIGENEECEPPGLFPPSLPPESCQTHGYDCGTLSCTSGCQVNTAACYNLPYPTASDTCDATADGDGETCNNNSMCRSWTQGQTTHCCGTTATQCNGKCTQQGWKCIVRECGP